MKIVVIGGTGLIGSRVAAGLRARGHEVLAASPSSGVNSVTGEGLDAALRGAEALVDVANSPSFEAEAAMSFFENAGRNIAAAEKRASVKHHVALSVVGSERLQDSGYFRAKLAQERLIKASGIPFTIVRATQFFEFMGAVAQDATTKSGAIRASTGMMQPMAADDVGAALVDVALAKPANRTIEIAGPEPFAIHEIVRLHLAAKSDSREVAADDQAAYFGQKLDRRALMPGAEARLGSRRFADWLRQTAPTPPAKAR